MLITLNWKKEEGKNGILNIEYDTRRKIENIIVKTNIRIYYIPLYVMYYVIYMRIPCILFFSFFLLLLWCLQKRKIRNHHNICSKRFPTVMIVKRMKSLTAGSFIFNNHQIQENTETVFFCFE